MRYFRLADCNDGFTQCIFNGHQLIEAKVVSTSHPSADFGLFLSQTQCKVFLFQTFRFLYLVYSVHDFERQIDHVPDFWIHLPASRFDGIALFHHLGKIYFIICSIRLIISGACIKGSRSFISMMVPSAKRQNNFASLYFNVQQSCLLSFSSQ